MRAIVTVIGKDQVGIIARVCALLSEQGINVLDISQTILQEYFTMIMLVDASASKVPFAQLVSLQGTGPGHPRPAGRYLQRHASDLRAEIWLCLTVMRFWIPST